MASLTVTSEGHWRQQHASSAAASAASYLYMIEPAKSNRGRCRKCSECVEKGELRFGIPIRDPRGEYGYISAWQHLGCTRINVEEVIEGDESMTEEERKAKLAPLIYGLSKVKDLAQQKAVIDEITSKVIPNHLKALDADDLVKRGVMERVEPPPTMLQHLLPFQKEGLGWMSSQELSEYKGGILADEMGMGKTIQTIALILRNKGVKEGPTLVVCPVSSMNQWEEEINKNVTPGTLEVKRVTKTTRINRDDLLKADVVLTTYPVLELSYRVIVNKSKVACAYCDKMFLPRQLKNHNKYFCGPNAHKTVKQAKQESSNTKRQRGGDGDEGDITFFDVDEDEEDSTANRPRKVQTKETILKGLRSLHIDVADLEDAADEEKKQPQPKPPSSASVDKKKKNTTNETAVVEPKAAKKVNITGPMSLMHNLMVEAGRKVRGRFEKRRENTDSDSSDDEDDDSSDEDFDDDDDDEDFDSSSSSDAEGGKKKKKAATKKKPQPKQSKKKVANEAESTDDDEEETDESLFAAALKCPDCGFQKLRYPFCPKSGNAHVTADEDTLNRQFLGETGDIADSTLHSIHWFRIILDEAHRIKSRTSNTSRSIYSLKAERKWCLTGTPLQNRVGDLYSLLRFLQVQPYAKYYCCAKGCSCSSLCHPFSWSSLRACVFCGHGPLHHYSYFNKHIMNPITRLGYIGEGKKALMLLTNGVLNALMLRRTKAERSEELKMPAMIVKKEFVYLTPEERDVYDALYKRSASKFDTFVKKGTMLHNYAHIFQLLSRLRQALDHPYLVTRNLDDDLIGVGASASLDDADGGVEGGAANENDNPTLPPPIAQTTGQSGKKVTKSKAAAAAASSYRTSSHHICGICSDDIFPIKKSIVVEPCKHAFHAGCLQQYVDEAPTEVSAAAPTAGDKGDIAEGKGKKTPAAKKSKALATEAASAASSSSANKLSCPLCFVPITFDVKRMLALEEEGELDAEEDDADDGGIAVKDDEDADDVFVAAPPTFTSPVADDEDGDEILVPVAPPGSADASAAGNTSAKQRNVKTKAEAQAPKGIMSRIVASQFVAGSKMKAMLAYINSVPKDEKCIVFSQYGGMLELLEFYFARFGGLHCVKLTGSQPMPVRQSILTAFRNDPSVRVILISLKAGGEGLNLQNANHVLLSDPWWNPAVEMQAVQRAHRIGQTRQVTAVRFVTHDSVEERMIELQDKKMLVFEGTIDGKATSLHRLSEEDMQFLFARS